MTDQSGFNLEIEFPELSAALNSPNWQEATAESDGSGPVQFVRSLLVPLPGTSLWPSQPTSPNFVISTLSSLLTCTKLLYRQTAPEDSEDRTVAQAAAGALSSLGEPGVLALSKALANPVICNQALEVLAQQQLVEPLLIACEERRPKTLPSVIQCLAWEQWAWEHHQRILEQLQQALSNTDARVVEAALSTMKIWLRRCCAQGELETVLQTVNLAHGFVFGKNCFAAEFIRCFPTVSLEAMAQKLDNPCPLTYGRDLLHSLAFPELQARLMELANPGPFTRQALHKLALLPIHRLSEPSVVSLLAKNVVSSDEHSCAYALSGMARLVAPHPELVWPHRAAISAALGRRRRASQLAIEALEGLKVGLHVSIPNLYPIWADSLKTQPTNLIPLACLIGDQGPVMLPFLIEKLEDPLPEIRRLAIVALASLGSEAAPALAKMTSDLDPLNAKLAQRALKTINAPG